MDQQGSPSHQPDPVSKRATDTEAMNAMADRIVAQSEAIIKVGYQSLAQSVALATSLEPKIKALIAEAQCSNITASNTQVIELLDILKRARPFPVPEVPGDTSDGFHASTAKKQRRRTKPSSFA
jgi:hypothetical protein